MPVQSATLERQRTKTTKAATIANSDLQNKSKHQSLSLPRGHMELCSWHGVLPLETCGTLHRVTETKDSQRCQTPRARVCKPERVPSRVHAGGSLLRHGLPDLPAGCYGYVASFPACCACAVASQSSYSRARFLYIQQCRIHIKHTGNFIARIEFARKARVNMNVS